MVELSNDLLTVSLHPKGAEIISIKGKKDQLNYIIKLKWFKIKSES